VGMEGTCGFGGRGSSLKGGNADASEGRRWVWSVVLGGQFMETGGLKL